MNREIEFRAWLKKEKKMVEVVSINFNDRLIAYNDNDKQELCINCSFNNIELMQYTGIKDKNGVKIFEGDIVKCKTNETLEIDDIGDVVYDDDCCSYFIISNETCIYLTSAWDLKVIGNIYENKELLEDE